MNLDDSITIPNRHTNANEWNGLNLTVDKMGYTSAICSILYALSCAIDECTYENDSYSEEMWTKRVEKEKGSESDQERIKKE